ncbi:MAG: chromosomal replication initiator protein DnaA [Candidatus Aenigmarchaeota archaeon]|nr:chromosomal replication initiator protein DnaA [Candidatus Aenigmarchaeota archaeon]
MDSNALWQSALGQLEVSISKANFTTWFKNTSITSFYDDRVTVSVPNIFTKEWLENKYHKQIKEALKNVLGTEVLVEYKVGHVAPIKDDILKEPLVSMEEVPTSSPGSLNPKYTFNNFVVGGSNKLAYAACKSVSTKPDSAYNPLFIYGGVGLGKTHLMQAIGNEIIKKYPKKKVTYITSERFTNEFITAIGTRKTSNFKEKYRKVDVLLVDDMQFLAGKEGTQEEFFHTFNSLHQDNKQIVLTSDRPPKAIPTLEERLRSRFEWGMIADIQPPDLETRIAILQCKAQVKGYDIPLEIIDYIAKNIQQNIRELEGALNRIIAYCELNTTPPTLNIATSVLGSVLSYSKRKGINTKEILEKTAAFYDLTIEELKGVKRDKEIVVPRQITMYLMREETKLSYPKIARELGGRDHTTVIHACNKIEKEIDTNEIIRHEISLIKERLYM